MRSEVMLIDLDGVVADYNGSLVSRGLLSLDEYTCEMWRDCPISEQRKGALKAITNEPGFFLSLSPFPEALEAINGIQQVGWIRAYIYSKTPRQSHAWSEKITWVERHLPAMSGRVSLVCTKEVIHADIVVDDSLVALLAVRAKLKILFQTNPKIAYGDLPDDVISCRSWQQVFAALDTFRAGNDN